MPCSPEERLKGHAVQLTIRWEVNPAGIDTCTTWSQVHCKEPARARIRREFSFIRVRPTSEHVLHHPLKQHLNWAGTAPVEASSVLRCSFAA